MNVYFISGLGADSRIFRHIQLPQGCRPLFLEWIEPGVNETLAAYALRLSAGIERSEPFALVGLSMGGMIAIEIAKALPPQVLVLISSIPSIQCLPTYYRFGGALGLHRVLPIGLLRSASNFKRYFTSESGSDKVMLREMISAVDSRFIKWGMGAILSWDNRDVPPSLVHIHGTGDFILPRYLTNPTHLVPRGGHLMVLTHAKTINGILAEVLGNATAIRG